jgi:kinetochore protein Spc24
VADEVTLKLKIYRGLGIDLVRDSDGEYTKAVIRNGSQVGLNVVNLDNKLSRFFYVNYFWQML